MLLVFTGLDDAFSEDGDADELTEVEVLVRFFFFSGLILGSEIESFEREAGENR